MNDGTSAEGIYETCSLGNKIRSGPSETQFPISSQDQAECTWWWMKVSLQSAESLELTDWKGGISPICTRPTEPQLADKQLSPIPRLSFQPSTPPQIMQLVSGPLESVERASAAGKSVSTPFPAAEMESVFSMLRGSCGLVNEY